MRSVQSHLLVVGLVVAVGASPRHREEVAPLREELSGLERTLGREQQLLQQTTDHRWSQRQRQVEQCSRYQQQSESSTHQIERLYTEIARLREEILLREAAVGDSRQAFESEQDKLIWAEAALQGFWERQEDAARAALPMEQQARARMIAAVTQAGGGGQAAGSLAGQLRRIDTYLAALLDDWRSVTAGRETVVPANNRIDEPTVLQVGNVFAVGLNDTGTAYYLVNTGGAGEDAPWEWVVLSDGDAARGVHSGMPRWLTEQRITGRLSVDVLQNRFSGELLGLVRKTPWAAMVAFFRSGGVVMYPLVLICLWAVVLAANRVVAYTVAHSRDDCFIDVAIEYLNRKKTDEARAFAESSHGVLAKILNACLRHSRWKRPVAEQAVKELLLAEVPALDRHLDTIAVLAGAAPLLGLLGTVTGMISMFESITRFGTADPQLLAGGISEALVTTNAGLAIAIPLLLIHNFLRNRRNHIQADMEMYAMRILNRLWPEE